MIGTVAVLSVAYLTMGCYVAAVVRHSNPSPPPGLLTVVCWPWFATLIVCGKDPNMRIANWSTAAAAFRTADRATRPEPDRTGDGRPDTCWVTVDGPRGLQDCGLPAAGWAQLCRVHEEARTAGQLR